MVEEAIFQDLTSPQALIEYARVEASKSDAKGRDGLTPTIFAANVVRLAPVLSERLRTGSYTFIPYRQVLSLKGAGKIPREISVPSARDRGVLKSLGAFLRRTVPESRGVLAQQRVRQLIDALITGRFKHFVRIDIENFYPSIAHGAADKAIDRFVRVPEAASVMKSSIRTPTLRMHGKPARDFAKRGVPQGLSISNALAEMVLSDFDHTWSGRPGLVAFRYVDDILILTSRRKHRAIFDEVSTTLKPLGLTCHPLQPHDSKSTWGDLTGGVDFLGYSLTSSIATVRSESVDRLKEKIAHRLLRYQKLVADVPAGISNDDWVTSCRTRLEWYLNLTIAGCVLDKHRRGWIHYFSLITDFSLLRSLDFYVDRKINQAGLTGHLQSKSFVKAYRRAIRVGRDHSNYVPNFDLYGTAEHRQILKDIFRVDPARVDRMLDLEAAHQFLRRVRREIETLETDLAIAY